MKIDRVGEVNKANNGMLMKIVAYRSYDSIDVQFENGIVVNNKSYGDFKKGKINLPKALERVGEVNKAKNGMLMKIIEYRNAKDIDVQFEDGVVVKSKSYKDFKGGCIPHPKFSTKVCKNRVGEVRRSNNGMLMKIIAYRSANDIDVQFEDGKVVKNKSYGNFKAGYISCSQTLPKDRVGEVNKATNGMMMRIIDYRSANDIDVQFEDGKVVKNSSYGNFKTGHISPYRQTLIKGRVGEVNKATNGMSMKILAYRNTDDIDVQFEDGMVARNKTYYNFLSGKIGHPLGNTVKRVGDVKVANNGLRMRVISHETDKNTDVQFEDGIIVTNKSYHSFTKGQIAHPMISKWGTSKSFYGFTNIRKSFEYNGRVYYLCKDLQGKGQVYTLQQMMKSAGVEPVF